jgi:hypothetical protein
MWISCALYGTGPAPVELYYYHLREQQHRVVRTTQAGSISMSRCCKTQVHAGSFPKGNSPMNEPSYYPPTHSPTRWWLLVGIIDKLFIYSKDVTKPKKKNLRIHRSSSECTSIVASECVSASVEKELGEKNPHNWLLRPNFIQEYLLSSSRPSGSIPL